MFQYTVRRLLDLIVVLLGVSVLVFAMVRFIPGDAVAIMLGANVDITPDRVEALRHQIGLDLPAYQQYWNWLTGVLRGDLGTSIWTGAPVLTEIRARLLPTFEITFLALVLALVLAIPLGVLAARTRGTGGDVVVRILAIIGLTLPSFWVGVLFLYFFSLYIPAWPAIGYVPFTEDPLGNLARVALPTVAVSLPMVAGITRILRSSLLEVMSSDYVRTARSKGVSERRVLYKHALRNALIPTVTVIGVQLGYLLSGVVVIEQVFAIPGVGRLMLGAINERNYPLLQGVVLIVTGIFVVVNLLVDLTYAWIDPRVEYV